MGVIVRVERSKNQKGRCNTMNADSRQKTVELFKDWQKNILPAYEVGIIDKIPEALQGVASEKEAYMFVSFVQASVDLFKNYMHIKDYDDLIFYLKGEIKKQKQA